MGIFKGKVVCITGAGRGIGRALAESFSEEGARLVLGARTTPEIDDLASRLRCAIAVQTDVRSAMEVSRLVETALAEFDDLDIMINNAGVGSFGPLESLSDTELEEMLDTNVKGVILGSRAAYRVMKERRKGLIVNLAAARDPRACEAAWAASKWAVAGFTASLRPEAADHGVRVTCVSPGPVNTPMWKYQDFYPYALGEVDPERDFLDPTDVARSILDLARHADRVLVSEVSILPLFTR